jgi:hypothetical protein
MHTKEVNISNNLLHMLSLAINTTAIHLLDRVINSSKIRGMHLIRSKTHMPSLSQSQFILNLNNLLGIANISLHMANRHQYSPNSIFISSQLDANAYKKLARSNKPSMHSSKNTTTR